MAKRITEHVLYVSFPLDRSTMQEETRKVEKVVGKGMGGAGSGFGQRDVEFYYGNRRQERDAAAERAKAAGYAVHTVRLLITIDHY